MIKKVCPLCGSNVKPFMRKSLDYWACTNQECKNSRAKYGFIIGENLVEVEEDEDWRVEGNGQDRQ